MIAVLLIILAGIFNAYMDKLRVWHNSRWHLLPLSNWFYNWGKPEFSWKNKWKIKNNAIIFLPRKIKEIKIFKWIITLKLGPWYYAWIYKPDYVERFPYSSTLLVSFTDAWHFFQKCWIVCVILAIVFYKPSFEGPWWNALYLAVIYGINFTVWYDYILDKKRKKDPSVKKNVKTLKFNTPETEARSVIDNYKDLFKAKSSPDLFSTLIKSILLDDKYKGRPVLFHISDKTVNGLELIIVENNKIGYYPTGLYFREEDRVKCMDCVVLLSEQVFGLSL